MLLFLAWERMVSVQSAAVTLTPKHSKLFSQHSVNRMLTDSERMKVPKATDKIGKLETNTIKEGI